MLNDGTPIYVRENPSCDTLIPGRLVICADQPPAIQFQRRNTLEVGAQFELLLHDTFGRFCSAPFMLLSMDAVGDQPVAQIEIKGKPKGQDRRKSPRIAVPDELLLVCVDGERSGSVIDIGEEGMAILIDTNRKPIGSWIDVDVTYIKRHIVGRLEVRSCRDQGDGFYRYGLKFGECADDPMRTSLASLTKELQQAADDAAASARGMDKKNLRRHARRPWPGVARAYVHEDGNLRVITVNTLDLAEGGLGFSCAQPIYEGRKLLFEKPTPNGAFCINAVVRSVRMIPGARYRVGVQFLGKPVKPNELPEEIRSLMEAKAA